MELTDTLHKQQDTENRESADYGTEVSFISIKSTVKS